ncbi:MAG: Calx-beta domain-containing protein, partial [Candidatus Promineifilaceae bacterium]
TVLATGDTVVENSETFTVSLGTPSKPNLSVANSPQTATITNDDGATITLSAGIAQNEGDSGTTAYVFTATLSAAVDGGVTVVYSADDGTATVADNDYIDSNGTLSFSGNAGETQTITILVTGDTKVELNEQFNVALGVPSNSSISTLNSPQTATIQNEDTASLSISDVTVAEGNSGTTSTTLTVTLSAAVDTAFSVAFASADNSATTAHNDYLASSGTLTFAGNANEQQTITLAFIGDEIVELDETFSVTLSTLEASGRNVTLLDDQGRITLTNEDVATLSITDVAQSETNSGTTTFVLSATLNAAVDMGLSVNFATADGTATAGSDYTAGNGTLLFSGTAGEVRTIQIEVMGDADIEPNETFSVTLEGISAENRNITLSNPTAIATIINDEIPSVTAVELSASPHIANEATFNWGILLLVILLSSGSAYVFMASRSKKSRHPQT